MIVLKIIVLSFAVFLSGCVAVGAFGGSDGANVGISTGIGF